MKGSSKSGEEELYEPIKKHLQTILTSYYVEEHHPPRARGARMQRRLSLKHKYEAILSVMLRDSFGE